MVITDTFIPLYRCCILKSYCFEARDIAAASSSRTLLATSHKRGYEDAEDDGERDITGGDNPVRAASQLSVLPAPYRVETVTAGVLTAGI